MFKIFGREKRSAVSTLRNPSPQLVDAMLIGESFAGERVSERKALGLVGVFAAVYKLGEGVGELPLKVYRITSDDGDSREEARGHRMWRVLHDKPNPGAVAHTFWAAVTARLALTGNAYLWKDRDDLGLVQGLWQIDPTSITVKVDGSGEKVFEHSGKRQTYTSEDILHIVGFSLDGFVGVSRLEYARNTLGTAVARDRYEGGFYQRGATVRGVIHYPGRLGKEGTERLADGFRDKHGGENMHKVPVLEEGATFNSMSMSLEDMQFVENAQLSLTEIAVLFDLPPGELGGLNGGSLEYATEELNQIRRMRALSPYASRIAKSLSNDPSILPHNIMYAEFNMSAAMRTDTKTQDEHFKALHEMGVIDEAYIARVLNLPPPPPKPTSPPVVAPPPSQDQAPANGNGNGNGVAALFGPPK